jgi:flagellar protein FliO/FliZ
VGGGRGTVLRSGRRGSDRPAAARAWLCALAVVASMAPPAKADGAPPSPTPDGRYQIVRHPKSGRPGTSIPASTSSWWMGTAGIALALAAFGGMSLAAKKFLPQSESGPLRVVGRTSLSPKHAVYLLKAGDKVLIVGTGPGGSPTLLGEMPPDAATSSPRPALRRAGGAS